MAARARMAGHGKPHVIKQRKLIGARVATRGSDVTVLICIFSLCAPGCPFWHDRRRRPRGRVHGNPLIIHLIYLYLFTSIFVGVVVAVVVVVGFDGSEIELMTRSESALGSPGGARPLQQTNQMPRINISTFPIQIRFH